MAATSRNVSAVPASFKSPVWRYFGFLIETVNEKDVVNKELAACKLCEYVSKYTGSTTNMSTHLKRHHPAEAADIESSKTIQTKRMTTDVPSTASKQPKLSDIFSKPYGLNSDRAMTITRSIGLFIAVDMRPYSIVENAGFKSMINTLDPKYKIPSRPYFSDKVIPQLYDETKATVVGELKNATSVAITTDGWTSRSVDSYITITAHYVTTNWKLCNRVLQTRIIHESHTAVNVGAVLSAAIAEWGLGRFNGQIPVVTDNASNMDGAVKAAGLGPNIKCFAHTVNLATQKGLAVGPMKLLLARVKRVVAFFRRSSVANSILKSNQDLLKLPKHKLIIDVPTRWNSSYDMMSRYLEQQPAITATLMSGDVRKNAKDLDTLREEDITNLEEAVNILKDMKDITTVLCDEKQPTVSLIYPMKEKILKTMELVGTESSVIKQLKVAILDDMRSRYNNTEIEQFLIISAAMDPRFKSLPQLDEGKRQDLYNIIIQKILSQDKSFIKSEPSDRQETQVPSEDAPLPALPSTFTSSHSSVIEPGPSTSGSTIKNLFGDVFITSVEAANKSPLDMATNEVHGYFREPVITLDSNPLEWWLTNGYRYPKLSNIAKYHLTVPGTSVPSERVFSTAGDIVTSQRSCLDPEDVDTLIFLKKNLKL